VQGCVRVPGRGDAYYRVDFAHIAYVGSAEWVEREEPETPAAVDPHAGIRER
jgi:hypothetical protein